MNAHDLIIDRILSALRQAPALAGGHINEEHSRMQGEDVDQYIVVRWSGSDPATSTIKAAPIDWTTGVTIECAVRRDDRDASTGRASRALHAQVYARLMADPSLGGAAFDVLDPRLTSDPAELDTNYGCVIAQYQVLHRTSSRTLEAS